MLDVHPPHQAAHTWKDFFIHIATIVVGLLIAVGLEQTVEFFHHRHELEETRKTLEAEREQNRRSFSFNVAIFRYATAMLTNNVQILEYVKQHPGTTMDKLPGSLRWKVNFLPLNDVAWKTTHENGITALMPRGEVADRQYVYMFLGLTDKAFAELYAAVGRAEAFSTIDPDPSHLDAAHLDAEMDLLAAALEEDYRWGRLLSALHHDLPDFGPELRQDELSPKAMAGIAKDQKARFAEAEARTDALLAREKAEVDAASTAADVDYAAMRSQKQRR